MEVFRFGIRVMTSCFLARVQEVMYNRGIERQRNREAVRQRGKKAKRHRDGKAERRRERFQPEVEIRKLWVTRKTTQIGERVGQNNKGK